MIDRSNVGEYSQAWGMAIDCEVEKEVQAAIDLEIIKARMKRWWDSLPESERRLQEQIDYMHTL